MRSGITYHACGKQRWDELPAMFSDAELAAQLDEDAEFWAYTYSFPHKFRTGADGEALQCTMEAWIKFRKSDGVFKKVLKPVD